jgi:hypothetical protein
LQEIGVDAELVNLDLKERQHKTEQFMKVNEQGNGMKPAAEAAEVRTAGVSRSVCHKVAT